MKKINKKILIITCIVCLLPIAIGLAYAKELPDSVVIHFDAKNNPDKYATRNQFIYGIPVIMMILQIACCVISDLCSKNTDKDIMPTFKWIIPVLTVTMYVITLAYALAKKLDIRRIAMIILSVMLLVIGNYIPQNTGKIQKKGKNKKTNKIPSIVLIIDGILSVMTILTDDVRYSIAVVIAIVVEVIILAVYAIILAKKKRAKPTTKTSSKVINSAVKVEVKTTTKPAPKGNKKRKKSANKKK